MRPRDEDEDTEGLEPVDDPTDPSHPDWDLSVSAPYTMDERRLRKPILWQRWAMLLIGLLALAGMLVPLFRDLL